MQLTLENAGRFLKAQTPKEYVQQLAVASEALRRAKLTKIKAGGDGATLLEEFRGFFEEKPNGRGKSPEGAHG